MHTHMHAQHKEKHTQPTSKQLLFILLNLLLLRIFLKSIYFQPTSSIFLLNPTRTQPCFSMLFSLGHLNILSAWQLSTPATLLLTSTTLQQPHQLLHLES